MTTNSNDTDCPRPAPGLPRATSLILEAVAANALAGQEFERITYQETIRTLSRQLTSDAIDLEQSIMVAGGIIQAIATYSHSVEERNRSRSVELQAIVSMLTGAIATHCRDSQAAVAGLRNVESILSVTCNTEDLRLAKNQLEECLVAVRAEATRHEFNAAHAKDMVHSMEQSAAIRDFLTVSHSDKGPDIDPLTDLPGRGQAIQALERCYEEGSSRIVVPLAIERIGTIRLRFGEDATAQLLFLTAQLLRQKLRSADQLFCWKGSCFLAILERNVPVELVRREVMRVVGSRIELNLNVGERSVLVPVTLSWLLLPSSEYTAPQRITQQINAFAAKCRD